MSYLAIDPSKSSTGWALWRPGWDKPRFGHETLGSAYTSRGQTLTKLRTVLIDLYSTVLPYEYLFHEAPIAHRKGQGTSTDNVRLALGLSAVIEGVGHELRCRQIKEYDPNDWRPGFCGRDEHLLIKRAARQAQQSARDPLKAAVRERCKLLGMVVRVDDESDAIGILSHGLLMGGITPPWLAGEVLRQPLEVRV